MGDVERIISKVAVGRVSPREVVQLKRALEAIGRIRTRSMASDNAVLRAWDIGIGKSPKDIPIGGEGFGYLDDMVIEISEIGLASLLDKHMVVSLYTADDLMGWSDRLL